MRHITEWRRLIGCLKLQLICRKRATNYRALLRKMTYGDKTSYDFMPHCAHMSLSAYQCTCHIYICHIIHVSFVAYQIKCYCQPANADIAHESVTLRHVIFSLPIYTSFIHLSRDTYFIFSLPVHVAHMNASYHTHVVCRLWPTISHATNQCATSHTCHFWPTNKHVTK